MSRLWRFALPCYVFTLPMTVVSFVIAVVFYRARSWVWYDGFLTCVASGRVWGGAQGQTIAGWLQVYDSDVNRSLADLRVHETVHTVQAFRTSLWGSLPLVLPASLGWLPWWSPLVGGFVGALWFAAAYVLWFVFHWARTKDWYQAYLRIPYEKEAYGVQDAYLARPSPDYWGA